MDAVSAWLFLILPVLFCCGLLCVPGRKAKLKGQVQFPLDYRYSIKVFSPEAIPDSLMVPVRNNTAETLRLGANSPDASLCFIEDSIKPRSIDLKTLHFGQKLREGYNCFRVEYTAWGKTKIRVQTRLHIEVEVISLSTLTPSPL